MESTKKMSFSLTSTEIKNLASYLIITTEWLCLNYCCNEYEKREKYCLIHNISRRCLFCYESWMKPLKKDFLFGYYLKIMKEKHTLNCLIF